MVNNNLDQEQKNPQEPLAAKPNESGGVSVTGFVKIFDPNTKEIIVESRA
jgi:hypothetical protein